MKALCVLCISVVSLSASAGDKATAERYFRAGASAFAAQSFEAAASDFEEAYKQLPLPQIAFSAAQAYRRAYRVAPKPEYVVRAVELYKAYLAEVKTGGRVADAADGVAEMQRELDRLKISAPTAKLLDERTRLGVSITVADQDVSLGGAMREVGDATGPALPGLTVMLDGKPVAPFALVDVDVKEHVIAVAADGYFPVEKKAMAVAGQSQLIEVELKAKPAHIVVATEGGAELAVDGRPAANPVDVAAGKHLLAIVRGGREPWTREIDVHRGQDLRLDAPLAPTARRRAVPWVLTAGGVLAGAAATTAVLAYVHDGRASDQLAAIGKGNASPSMADAYDREVASRDHYLTATWVLGGGAATALVVACGLYCFDHPLVAGRF